MKPDDIGNLVRFHRKQSGLSQQELAKLAGVGKTVVYDIEKGKETVRLKTLMNVLDILNIRLTLIPPFEMQLEKDK